MTMPSDRKPQLGRRRTLKTAQGPMVQELRYITSANGWVMCRVPGAAPFVMSRRDWDKLERTE